MSEQSSQSEDYFTLYSGYSDDCSFDVLYGDKKSFEELKKKIEYFLENDLEKLELQMNTEIQQLQIHQDNESNSPDSIEKQNWSEKFAVLLVLLCLAAIPVGLIHITKYFYKLIIIIINRRPNDHYP